MSTADAVTEYRQHRFRPPPGATDMLLIRHGESAPARPDEPAPLLDGQSDPDLDPHGRQEARLVADRLRGEEVAAIYTSTLRRTAQTAEPLAAQSGLTPMPTCARSSSGSGRERRSASGSPSTIRWRCGASRSSAGTRSPAASRSRSSRPTTRH
jgi:hypothetical protein